MPLFLYKKQKNKLDFYAKLNAPTVSVDQLHPKNLLETVKSYNASKVDVEVLDRMARYHTCKSVPKKWPVRVFFNIF